MYHCGLQRALLVATSSCAGGGGVGRNAALAQAPRCTYVQTQDEISHIIMRLPVPYLVTKFHLQDVLVCFCITQCDTGSKPGLQHCTQLQKVYKTIFLARVRVHLLCFAGIVTFRNPTGVRKEIVFLLSISTCRQMQQPKQQFCLSTRIGYALVTK